MSGGQLKGFFFFLFLLKCFNAQSELAFSSNSRTFEDINSSLVVKGLAHACLTQSNIPDQLLCNPALTPLNKKAGLSAELLLSNGYSNLQSIRSLLSGNFDETTADTFFTKDKVIQIDAGININFYSKFLNGQFNPMSIKAFSVVRNEANPDIDFYSVEESGFTFQSGYEIYEDFFLGLQTRLLDRKYIKSRFKLTALGTQEGREALTPKKQNIILLEPGFSWYSKLDWKPRFSIFLANSGFYNTDDESLKKPLDLQFGFGLTPEAWWGDWDLNLDFKSLSYNEKEWYEKIHLGSLYKFGSMYLTSGVDANGISCGVFYGLDKFNAGVLYSTTKYIKDNDNYFTQTVYVQIGWQI